MNHENSKFWPVPVSILVALATFAGTYYAYAERRRLHEEGSLLPALIGLAVFIAAMLFLTDQLVPAERKDRKLVLAATVAGETIGLFVIFMLLLLNTFGS
jgi:hypothetical protein